MKILLIFIVFLFIFTSTSFAIESCQVKNIVGANVEPGKYKVDLLMKNLNLFQVMGTDIFIETIMCLEMPVGDTAILEINHVLNRSNVVSRVIGELHFIK